MTSSIDLASLRAMRLQSQRVARSAASAGGASPAGSDPDVEHTGSDTDVAHAVAHDVAKTVRALLAIQAQDFAQAVWAVGLRTPGCTRGDVLEAMANGSVIRSAPIRGTLHFLPAEDLRWMLRLTAPRTLTGVQTRFRELGLNDDTFDRAAQVAQAEMSGGVSLGREEFLALVRAAGISTEGQRGYHIIFALSQRALVCWGPPRANQQALVLVDEWIPQSPEFDRPNALREFALRYFAGHGPATVRDFAWWSKLTLADARAGVERARDALVEFTFAGQSMWATATAMATATVAAGPAHDANPDPTPTRALGSALHAVHLLAGFDEYLLGYQDRSPVLAEEHVQYVIPGKNGIFRPTLLWDGRVIGTWRKGDAAAATSIIDEPFAALSSRQAVALRRAEKSYRAFVGD